MLGRYVYTYLSRHSSYTIIGVTRDDFTISDETLLTLDTFLITKGIDANTCVINCIGMIPQRRYNTNYYTINTLFPLLLGKYCTKYNARYIHPTTDCVFNGDKGGYIETDYHTETSEYGISKSLGEPLDHTVIRTSIIGEECFNKCSLLEWVKQSKGIISGWENHLWNGITCLHYAKIIHTIIKDNLFWKGVRHLYSPQSKSKYELVYMIALAYNVNVEIKPARTDYNSNKTLCSMYHPLFTIPSLEEQLDDLIAYDIS